MEEILHGIVLDGVSIGENDKILNIFTLEKGTVSAKIKGVKKAGAKLKFAKEPFCFAEFVFSYLNERRTVIGATLLDSFYPIRNDIKVFYMASAVLEFVKRFAKEYIVSEKMFSLIINTLKELAYGKDNDFEKEKTLISFFISALSVSGYALSLNGCFICKEKITKGKVYFDYKTGAFYCGECYVGEGREICLSTYLSLYNIANGLSLQDGNLNKCLKLIEYYITNKTDEKIKSLKELLQLLS